MAVPSADMSPLVVVEGAVEAMTAAVADARSAGWRVLSGWELPTGPLSDARPADAVPTDVVLAGAVRGADDARAAMLAAVVGVGLIAHARADRDVIDAFCDDLRHLGTLDHRVGDDPAAALSTEERQVLELLAVGMTLGQAATRLHLSRRSADRRLASARGSLGVATSGEAVIAYRERLDRIGRPPG